MENHFFSFLETIDGEPQPVHIEIVVKAKSRKAARPIAMAKMKQIRESEQMFCEKVHVTAPEYRFVGVN